MRKLIGSPHVDIHNISNETINRFHLFLNPCQFQLSKNCIQEGEVLSPAAAIAKKSQTQICCTRSLSLTLLVVMLYGVLLSNVTINAMICYKQTSYFLCGECAFQLTLVPFILTAVNKCSTFSVLSSLSSQQITFLFS